MSLIWLLFAVDAPAPVCEPDTSLALVRAQIEIIAEAASARDIETFKPAFQTVVRQVACLSTVVQPRDAASLHAARYLSHAVDSDQGAMAFELLAMQDVPGGGGVPPWLPVPPGVESAKGSPWAPVLVPEQLALFVDGVPATQRPLDRSAIYQAVGPGGLVQWTRWLDGTQELPAPFRLDALPAPADPEAGRALLEQVTDLLSSGAYDRVVELAVPAAAAHPDLAPSFRAAADLAVDQLERARSPVMVNDLTLPTPYAYRTRQGSERRGDERTGVLLGFDVGLPVGVRGEWKLGGLAVDGVGVRIGGNLLLTDASSGYTGTDTSVYLDWNLTPRWQLETGLGLFVTRSGSAYGLVGGALQYDPPTPLQVNAGIKVGVYGYVAPDVGVSFLW